MVRHRACYEDSAMASRTGTGPIRYGLLSVAEDILVVRHLARDGGAGPVGPNYERLYWHETEHRWTETPPGGDL